MHIHSLPRNDKNKPSHHDSLNTYPPACSPLNEDTNSTIPEFTRHFGIRDSLLLNSMVTSQRYTDFLGRDTCIPNAFCLCFLVIFVNGKLRYTDTCVSHGVVQYAESPNSTACVFHVNTGPCYRLPAWVAGPSWRTRPYPPKSCI